MRDASARTVLSFDYGLNRIGIASGDTITSTAPPRTAVRVLNGEPDWHGIQREVDPIQPQILVVGVPHHADGSPSPLTTAARHVDAALERRFGLPVKHVDERWSSLEAGALLKGRR